MKTPRVKDFDPNAKVEPVLKSSFDNMPVIERPKAPDHEAKSQPVPPVLGVLPVPLKRIMKQRWPIDIYQDQYDSLKQLALEERKQGGIGSMSAMVREAIDKLIAERRR
jgi:hypothetical protein